MTVLLPDPNAVQTETVRLEIPYVRLGNRLNLCGVDAAHREEASVLLWRAYELHHRLLPGLAAGQDCWLVTPGAPARPYLPASLCARAQLGDDCLVLRLAARLAEHLAAFARMLGQRTADDALASLLATYAEVARVVRQGGALVFGPRPQLVH